MFVWTLQHFVGNKSLQMRGHCGVERQPSGLPEDLLLFPAAVDKAAIAARTAFVLEVVAEQHAAATGVADVVGADGLRRLGRLWRVLVFAAFAPATGVAKEIAANAALCALAHLHC
jgi:hypothetical protein